ncbi:MAG: GNAT family N-acetyltransferase, partial [Chloroflexota bacterium]
MRQINVPLPAFPTLETANLRLREIVPTDAEAIFRVFADEEVTRYYDLEAFANLDQARSHIGRQATRYQRGELIRWGI